MRYGAYLFPKKNLNNENNNIMKQETERDEYGGVYRTHSNVKNTRELQIALKNIDCGDDNRQIVGAEIVNETFSWTEPFDQYVYVKFLNSTIKWCTFKDKCISKTEISGGRLENLVFENCFFKNILIRHSKINHIEFRNCIIFDFEIRRCTSYDINFGNSTLWNIEVYKGISEDVKFKDARIVYADFYEGGFDRDIFTKEQKKNIFFDY